MPITIVLRILLFLAVACAFGALGYVGGRYWASPDVATTQAQDEDGNDPAHDHNHDDGTYVAISTVAAENLNVATKTMRPETYVVPLAIPGQVVEIPGRSSFTVASPLGGNIRQVHVDVAQLVQAGTPLFTLEIVDEPVIAAQIDLLDLLGQIDVTQAELERLSPLAQSGAVAGRSSLEVEYQLQKLRNSRDARVQELQARGLTAQQVSSIVENRALVRTIEVVVDRPLRSVDPSAGSGGGLVIESLDAFPGATVERGQSLARLADHEYLYIRGEAFEEDVPHLYRLQASASPIEVQFGHSHATAAERSHDTRLATIAYIDNHADNDSGTFYFFLRLENEVAAESLLLDQSRTRQWRFKPGQRVHLRLPLREYVDQFVLPREAVVEEGVESFVFQQVFGHADDGMQEFRQVPVRILHRDTHTVVIDRRGSIRLGDTLVVNQAFPLYLELLSQTGESGGHHHGHDH